MKCPKCGRKYKLGYDGIDRGCDDCLGVCRGPHGFWLPDEKEATYLNVITGKEFTVTREKEFGIKTQKKHGK